MQSNAPIATAPNGISGNSQLTNMLLLAKHELVKLLFNRRGVIALAAFALVWGLLLWYPIREASSFLIDPNFRQLLASVFGEAAVGNLFLWPVAEMAVFWVAALYLFPLFSIFVCADQFSSDKTRGTFRFISLRTGRNALFFGRFSGYMLIQMILLAITVIASVLLASSREASLLMSALMSGVLVFINITIILLPYTAMMALLSLYANSARQATIYAILFWAITSIVIGIVSHYLPMLSEALQWILPGAQISLMINTQGIGTLAYAPIPIIQAVVLLFIGRSYMMRSAL